MSPDSDYGKHMRQFHRQSVVEAAKTVDERWAKDNTNDDSFTKKLENAKDSDHPAGCDCAACMKKTKDCEPEASGQYAADADLIPIDDAQPEKEITQHTSAGLLSEEEWKRNQAAYEKQSKIPVKKK